MSDAPDFKLSPEERDSAIWRGIEGKLKARLESLRVKNDGDATPEATARLRGRIAEVKDLLALGKAPVETKY